MGNTINAFVYAHNDDAIKSNMFPDEPRSHYDALDWYFEGIYERYLIRRARIAPMGIEDPRRVAASTAPLSDISDEVSTQASDSD